MHRDGPFRHYLAWYHSATRYRLRQAWTHEDFAEINSSDDENTPYDIHTRQGPDVEIAPVLDRVVSTYPLLLYYSVRACVLSTGLIGSITGS
jgi:hypothetical protein